MAQTMPAFSRLTKQRFSEEWKRGFVEPIRALMLDGPSFPISIKTRTAWDDAIAWLEAREAARAEWPWPER